MVSKARAICSEHLCHCQNGCHRVHACILLAFLWQLNFINVSDLAAGTPGCAMLPFLGALLVPPLNLLNFMSSTLVGDLQSNAHNPSSSHLEQSQFIQLTLTDVAPANALFSASLLASGYELVAWPDPGFLRLEAKLIRPRSHEIMWFVYPLVWIIPQVYGVSSLSVTGSLMSRAFATSRFAKTWDVSGMSRALAMSTARDLCMCNISTLFIDCRRWRFCSISWVSWIWSCLETNTL